VQILQGRRQRSVCSSWGSGTEANCAFTDYFAIRKESIHNLPSSVDSESGGFENEGDLIIFLGECGGGLGGSEYLKSIHSLKVGDSPGIDLEKGKRVQRTCLEAIKASSLKCSQCILHELKMDNLKKTDAIFG